MTGRIVGAFVVLLLLPVIFKSCSLEDGRDECCWQNTVFFRYEYEGKDCFQEYIHTARWFLFDEDGDYVQEMERMSCCPQRVDISSLRPGEYTLICLGNLTDYGTLEGHTVFGLDSFRLQVGKRFDTKGTFANGDRLYWGECRFTVVAGGSNRFRGEMSHVHCVLRIRVEWELVPEYSDGYRFTLDGVGVGMFLCGEGADAIGVHRFPPVTAFSGRMSERSELRRFVLRSELVSLRWDNAHIPGLQLWHEDESVCKAIDLQDVFHCWNWRPERTPVQEYSIRLLIRADGKVVVSQNLEAGVKDWADGGVIG